MNIQKPNNNTLPGPSYVTPRRIIADIAILSRNPNLIARLQGSEVYLIDNEKRRKLQLRIPEEYAITSNRKIFSINGHLYLAALAENTLLIATTFPEEDIELTQPFKIIYKYQSENLSNKRYFGNDQPHALVFNIQDDRALFAWFSDNMMIASIKNKDDITVHEFQILNTNEELFAVQQTDNDEYYVASVNDTNEIYIECIENNKHRSSSVRRDFIIKRSDAYTSRPLSYSGIFELARLDMLSIKALESVLGISFDRSKLEGVLDIRFAPRSEILIILRDQNGKLTAFLIDSNKNSKQLSAELSERWSVILHAEYINDTIYLLGINDSSEEYIQMIK